MRLSHVQGYDQPEVIQRPAKAIFIASILAMIAFGQQPGDEPAKFGEINERTVSHGFRAAAVYLNDADQPFGAASFTKKPGSRSI
jgi:hypothetical protein